MVDCAVACGAAPVGSGDVFAPSCTVGGVTYPAVSVYLPKFVAGNQLLRSGTAVLSSCVNCLNGAAVDRFSSGKLTGQAVLPSGFVQAAGTYTLDVRYANGGTGPAYLQILVDGVPAANGTATKWDFPRTGGNDTWGTRSIRVTVKAGSTVTLRGAAGFVAPRVDAVSLKFAQ
jgi:hypothetical protein